MTGKEKLTLILTSFVVITLFGIGLYQRMSDTKNTTPENNAPASALPGETTFEKSLKETGFSKNIPADAAPTKPKESVKIGPSTSGANTLGIYSITATTDGYSPATITVYESEVVRLELKSNGGEYDLYSPVIGFYVSSKNGVTNQITFKTPETGTFLFECRDHCPPNRKISGSLIVKPK